MARALYKNLTTACPVADDDQTAPDRSDKQLVGAVNNLFKGSRSRKHNSRLIQDFLSAWEMRHVHCHKHISSAGLRSAEQILQGRQFRALQGGGDGECHTL